MPLHWCRVQARPGASLLVQDVGLVGAVLLIEGGHARCPSHQYCGAGSIHCPPRLLDGLPRPTEQVHRVVMSLLCGEVFGFQPCSPVRPTVAKGAGEGSLQPPAIQDPAAPPKWQAPLSQVRRSARLSSMMWPAPPLQGAPDQFMQSPPHTFSLMLTHLLTLSFSLWSYL